MATQNFVIQHKNTKQLMTTTICPWNAVHTSGSLLKPNCSSAIWFVMESFDAASESLLDARYHIER